MYLFYYENNFYLFQSLQDLLDWSCSSNLSDFLSNYSDSNYVLIECKQLCFNRLSFIPIGRVEIGAVNVE